MIGATVNLAARFMQHADGRVLIDAASRRSCGDRIAFEEAEYVSLKGFRGRVEVHEVLEVHSAAKADTLIAGTEMVGRTGEMDRLETALDRVLDGTGGAAVVEGEAGIGKSRIVAALRAASATRGITWRFGITDAMSQSTPYYAWRGVFEGIFEIGEIEDPAERGERVLAHLGDDDELLRRAPLLNAIVQTTFPETEHTRQLTGQARADNTRSLLVSLLRRASDAVPTIVVLEDAHWMDSASWSLAAQATLLAPSLLLVLATRPLPAPPPADYERFLRATGDDHLVLGGLPREGIEHIVGDRLGAAASIPAVVVDWIHERAQGNPFFSQELAYALVIEGLLTVDDGEITTAPTRAQLEAFPLPPTVEGTLLFRIDRLTLPQQFALKTASALGLVVPVDAVRAAFPMDEERARLDKHLDALHRADLCQPVISGDDAVYTFKHRYTQEVAYSTMLRDQRAGIHRAVAGWYESQEAENLEPFYPLLAHHWGARAGRRQDAALPRAGGRAGAAALATGRAPRARRTRG